MVLQATRLLCVLLLPVLGLVPALCVAQSPAREAGLWWNAPAGCPDQAEVAQRLARIPGSNAYVVEAQVERVGELYSLRLRVVGARQHFERSLQAQTCELLAQSAVWLIELGLAQHSDPSHSQRSAAAQRRDRSTRVPAASQRSQASDVAQAQESDAPSEPNAVAPSLPAIAPAPLNERASAVEAPAAVGGTGAVDPGANDDDTQPVLLDSGPPRTTDVRPADAGRGLREGEAEDHLRVGLGVAAADMGLGGVRPQLAVDVTLLRAAFSFAARVGALMPAELWVTADARLQLWTAAGQLLACRGWQLSRFQTGPCATFAVLHTRVDTQGLAADTRGRGATWLVGGAAWQLSVRVVRELLLGAELGFALPVSARPSFEVSARTVAQAAAVSGYGQLSAIFEVW